MLSWAWRTRLLPNLPPDSGRDLPTAKPATWLRNILRERLEEEDEHDLYDVSHADVARMIKRLGTS